MLWSCVLSLGVGLGVGVGLSLVVCLGHYFVLFPGGALFAKGLGLDVGLCVVHYFGLGVFLVLVLV